MQNLLRVPFVVGATLLSFSAFAWQTVYSADFNGLDDGALDGQGGWIGTADGAASSPAVVDLGGGNKAVKLEITDTYGDQSTMECLYDDPIAKGAKVVRASFDIYRIGLTDGKNPQNLWWGLDGNNPDYGIQWDMSKGTMPFGFGGAEAPTVYDRFATLTVQYDLVAGTRSSWYDGAAVDVNTPFDASAFKLVNGYWMSLRHDAAVSDVTRGEYAYIDNVLVQVDQAVPERASLAVLGLGLLAFRRRR